MNKFEILTPLNFRVRTSEEYWQKLIIKHPDIAALEAEIQQALAEPDEIRQSSRDSNVLLFLPYSKREALGGSCSEMTQWRWLFDHGISNRRD